jgi:hypothetical protein
MSEPTFLNSPWLPARQAGPVYSRAGQNSQAFADFQGMAPPVPLLPQGELIQASPFILPFDHYSEQRDEFSQPANPTVFAPPIFLQQQSTITKHKSTSQSNLIDHLSHRRGREHSRRTFIPKYNEQT